MLPDVVHTFYIAQQVGDQSPDFLTFCEQETDFKYSFQRWLQREAEKQLVDVIKRQHGLLL